MNVWGRRISGKLTATLAALALLVFGSIVALSGSLTGIHGLGARQAAVAPACASKFSVSPVSASAGAQITIQGSAWPAGKPLGVYLVDPTHKLHPTTLQILTIPQSGAWKTTVTAPGSVTFHAVGDETTGNGAPQTFNQVVAPGRYLIYASAGDAASYSAKSVCPVQFTLVAASGAANTSASLPSSGGSASAAGLDAPQAAVAPSSLDSTMPILGGGLFLALLIALFYTLTRGRGRGGRVSLGSRRKPFAVISGALGLLLIATSFVPLTGLGTVHAAAAGTTLYSDDFEADTLGTVPAGWTVEVGSNWSVQLNGTQALAQTNSSATPLYGIYAGSPTWTDYSVSASVQPGPGSTTANTSVVAIDGRRQDVNNFYSLLVKNGNQWYLGKKVAGTWSTFAYGSISYTTTGWYTFTLTMTGSTISASINGTALATVTDTTFTAGNIGFKTHNQSAFDNVVVTATGAGAPTPTPTTPPAPTATPTGPVATATATPFGSGSISGQVTDAGSGAPIVNARVSTVPASITTTTDSSGNYSLASVGSGSYDVVFTASGYNANHVANVTVTNGAALTASGALQGVPGYTAMDTYTQPNQSGWTPSTDGNTWADDASVYPGASVSIQNNQGYVDTYTAATDRDEWMSVNYASQLVSADFNVLQFGQDSYQHGARLLGRVQDGHHFIDFAINYATSTLQIWVNNNENWTMLKQINVPAFTTGQWYHARLLTSGSMVYGKVWAYGTAEPGWMISGSQTSLTTGSGGVRSTFCDIYWTNYSLQAVTTITGVVTNTSGVAIAGATVSDGTQAVTTDAAGRYALIEPNTNASYTVTASATGYTTQSAQAATTGLASTSLNFTL